MADKIRWGILSTGGIARRFAMGLQTLPDARITAVGSRSRESAEEFGEKFNIPHRHASYEALCADPDVDAIYVATPHVFHRDNTVMALNAGKAVLCEKPFAINGDEAREMIDLARERRLFLMEAFWSRFLPSYVQIRQWLAEKRLGTPVKVLADFTILPPRNPEGRLYNPALGGGALLDIGCYTLQLATLVFGPSPNRIASLAVIGDTGVDEQAGYVLGYKDGGLAVLTCGFGARSDSEARIIGDKGRIHLHGQFNQTVRLTLVDADGEIAVDCPYESTGLQFQAADMMSRMRAGELESPIMPLHETLSMMETMDAIRTQWGMKYPGER